MNPLFQTINELSAAEKLQLVEDLWDNLAANPESVPVQDWQIQELDRRKANLKKNPSSALQWDDIKRIIRTSQKFMKIIVAHYCADFPMRSFSKQTKEILYYTRCLIQPKIPGNDNAG